MNLNYKYVHTHRPCPSHQYLLHGLAVSAQSPGSLHELQHTMVVLQSVCMYEDTNHILCIHTSHDLEPIPQRAAEGNKGACNFHISISAIQICTQFLITLIIWKLKANIYVHKLTT